MPGMIERSRWMSWALRHDPSGAGITLDPAGWTTIDGLLAAARRHGYAISRAELEAIVATNDKRRFAISADGLSIRASQGHSVPVDLGLQPLAPPERLYHGTADRFVASILASGLERRQRQQVHLSAEQATAISVGGRHGRPVVLCIAAGRMHADGHVFTRSANGVWLVDAVPPAYISVAS